MQHISSKGESHDDLLLGGCSRKARTDIFLPSTEYPLFTIPSESFLCMIKWTFVRINYHYMGLPFLCMLGSLRITGRLLHIFKPPPSTRSAFIFSIRQFLVRRWVFADLKPCQRLHFHIYNLRKTCVRTYFCASYYRQCRIIIFFFFMFLPQNYRVSCEIPPRRACCCVFHMSLSSSTSLTFQLNTTNKCEGHVLRIL